MTKKLEESSTRQLTLFNAAGDDETKYLVIAPPQHTLHPSFTGEKYTSTWWRDLLCVFVYERFSGKNKPEIKKYIHEHPNRSYVVKITPAIIEDKKGDFLVKFPTAREEAVYQALRYIALNKRKSAFLKLSMGLENIGSDHISLVQAALYTSKNEIKAHLSSINKTLSLSEINEALTILTKSHLEITCNGMLVCAEPYINISNRYKDEEIGKRYTENIVIQFPRYESEEFIYDIVREYLNEKSDKGFKPMRQIDLEFQSKLTPREFRLYRHFCWTWINANHRQPIFKISENERIKDLFGITTVESKHRIEFKRTLDKLVKNGVIEHYEEDRSLREVENRVISERVWCIQGSKKLISDIIAANCFAKRRRLESDIVINNYVNTLFHQGIISRLTQETLLHKIAEPSKMIEE